MARGEKETIASCCEECQLIPLHPREEPHWGWGTLLLQLQAVPLLGALTPLSA